MVDINLMGDDQNDFEKEPKKQEFQPTYETESNEPPTSSYMGRGMVDDTDYSIGRSRSKKTTYLLIFFGLILLGVVGYYLLQQGKPTKPLTDTTTGRNDTQPFDDAPGNIGTVSQPGMGGALNSALREKITYNYRGITTVNTIIKTIPANVNFTMISYNDGKFLLEFIANSDADINAVNSQLQQSLASSEINLLSKETRNVQNRQVRQALVNGNVNLSQGLGEVTVSQEPTYLSADELKNQLANISKQVGLSLKQYESGLEKSDGVFRISPIKFRASGKKENVLAFLQQLLNQNLNISFAKISLINLQESNITLVLNINLYRM